MKTKREQGVSDKNYKIAKTLKELLKKVKGQK